MSSPKAVVWWSIGIRCEIDGGSDVEKRLQDELEILKEIVVDTITVEQDLNSARHLLNMRSVSLGIVCYLCQ